MRTVNLTSRLPDEEADALAGLFLDGRHYDLLLDEPCEVRKPDGSVLLKLVRPGVELELCEEFLPNIRKSVGRTAGRGTAAGVVPRGAKFSEDGRSVAKASRIMYQRLKKDGTVSSTNESIRSPESGILGYFDRYARFPYCRETAFTLDDSGRWDAILPYLRAVDAVFARHMPDRYATQRALVERTSQDFVIKGTAFTTVTVNRNFRTACHKDAGDLKEGFGVMTAFRCGAFSGGELVFPAFRVAAKCRTGDVLLADVHEWHGNTPLRGVEGKYERVSCVFYYRSKMAQCGTAEQELERAKARKKGDPLYD
jgi:hypothetical protein